MEKNFKSDGVLHLIIKKINQGPDSIIESWAYEPHYALETGNFHANHCNYNNGGFSNYH